MAFSPSHSARSSTSGFSLSEKTAFLASAFPVSGLKKPLSSRRRSLRSIVSLILLAGFIFLSWDHVWAWRDNYGRSRYENQSLSDAFANNTANVPQPLTELGLEADLVYENIGSIDRDIYRKELEDFLALAFPATDSNSSDPDSLISILHEFMPPPPGRPDIDPQTAFRQMLLAPFVSFRQKLGDIFIQPSAKSNSTSPPPSRRTIPLKIHQTSPNPGDRGAARLQMHWSSWLNNNKAHVYTHYDNEAAKNFINRRFDGTGRGGMRETYWSMKSVPVMQSDFWRYAVLATEGGVYTDMDTICLKPISTWHRPPWQRSQNLFTEDPYPLPSIIVGIEQDVGSRSDWHAWWPRPLGLAQWTIASTPGHPIMIDVLRRVSEAVNPYNTSSNSSDTAGAAANAQHLQESAHRKLDSVVEKTGPGPFTDSVLRYLHAKYNTTWPALRRLPDEGIMFMDAKNGADVLVLSVTAFSPGVGLFNSGDVNHAAALSQHLFKGTWKAQYG